MIQCVAITGGIRFTFDYGQTWPMRFTANTASCQNYNPDFMVNVANAIGYAKWSITQSKSGNSCTLTWLDGNGAFQSTTGNAGKILPYVVEFTN